jgi:site-specific DNA-methyltransferase (adenine-specific)
MQNFDVQNIEGMSYLQSVQDNSINLILTDPPYIISKDSGMNKHYNNVKQNNNIERSEENWEEYKKLKNRGLCCIFILLVLIAIFIFFAFEL